jgi:hypothetical protein
MKPPIRFMVVLITLAALWAPPAATHSGQPLRIQAAPTANTALFLPIVHGPISPAGVYDCVEYEFGLVWTTEVITLTKDGHSTYEYHFPPTSVITGTWVYTPTTQEVGFTNFRWITATVQMDNRLWASRYVPGADFYVALSCTKYP